MENRLHRRMEARPAHCGYIRETMLRNLHQSARVLLLLGLLLSVSPALAKRAPDPALKALDKQPRKLSALRGQAVVVNFWATWCGPCQEELPRLSQLAAAYAGKPVRFVLISIDEAKDRAKIPGRLAKLGVALESWVGADTDTLGSFGLGDIVPGTVILDEQGEIVARVMGEARDEDVRQAVDWVLGGKLGTAPAPMTRRY